MLKKIFFISIICTLSIILGCNSEKENNSTAVITKLPENILPYRLLEEKLTKRESYKFLSIILLIDESDTLTKNHINDFVTNSLNHYIDKYEMNNSFETNQISLFVYTSREKANSGMGQWIAKTNFDSKKVRDKAIIDEVQFNALKETKSEKWGLSYDKRQAIWLEIIKAEDKARIASGSLKKTTKNSTNNEINKAIEAEEDFKRYYKREILKKYNIEFPVLDSISDEGLKNGWSF